jgi:hypothetical protein
MVANKKSGLRAVKGKRIGVEQKTLPKTRDISEAEVSATIDRRENNDRRSAWDRRVRCTPVATEQRTLQRRVKVNRRRQIDPTTCERDYTPDEIEFMSAMDEYKRRNGRMFPTCSEVLEVVKSLGYEKRSKTAEIVVPALDPSVAILQSLTPVG